MSFNFLKTESKRIFFIFPRELSRIVYVYKRYFVIPEIFHLYVIQKSATSVSGSSSPIEQQSGKKNTNQFFGEVTNIYNQTSASETKKLRSKFKAEVPYQLIP